MAKRKARLGDEVKDTVTGLVGIATARTFYYNGCVQFCIVPRLTAKQLTDGVLPAQEGLYCDEAQVGFVSEGLNAMPKAEPKKKKQAAKQPRESYLRKLGGPQPNTPSARYGGKK